MYVLKRRLSDCDDSELIELTEQLAFLCEARHEFASDADRHEHEARLSDCLDAIDIRISVSHQLSLLDDLS